MIRELLSRGGLSLDRLQTFCLVAQAGGITRAANGDATKQSLYSRQIKELEQFFGAELMRRKGRGIVLTSTGERLYVLAREHFTALSDFKKECEGQPVELTIAAGDSIIQWLLLPNLNAIRERLPKARFRFLNLPTSTIVERVADGIVDLGVVRKSAVRRPLKCTSLGKMTYSLFLPAGNPRLRRNKSWNVILSQTPLATLEGGGSFRKELARLSAKDSGEFTPALECSSFPLVARAVRHGGIGAILPSMSAVELGDTVKQCDVPGLQELTREMCLVWLPRAALARGVITSAVSAISEQCRL